MAGVMNPGHRVNSTLLDYVLKGVQVAADVYGVSQKNDQMAIEQQRLQNEADYRTSDLGYKKTALQQAAEQKSALTDATAAEKQRLQGNFDAELAYKKQRDQAELDLKRKELAQKGSDKAEKPATADQSKAALFAKRMSQAENVFGELESGGFDRADRTTSMKAMLPNAMLGEDIKRQDQAERNFLSAVLRRESGASISPSEMSNGETQYFPRAGDTEKVKEQKRQNRALAIEGLAAEAGSALDKIKDPTAVASGGSQGFGEANAASGNAGYSANDIAAELAKRAKAGDPALQQRARAGSK